MKKGSLIIILFLSICSISQAAGVIEPQPVTRSQPYKKMLHFNPLSLTVGVFDMGIELATTPKETFFLDLGYYLSENAGGLDAVGDYSNMNGLRLEAQYRFYRKNNNYIRNIYLAPFANLKTLNADYTSRDYIPGPQYKYVSTVSRHTATAVSFGYMLGMRKSIFENVYMDLGMGGGVVIPVSGSHHSDLHIGLFNPLQKGVQFKASFGFCIAL